MTERIRILFLSANPWTTSRILVDEEAREIFEKLQEGSHRDKFELIKHEAIRAIDLQRLLMTYEPQIVHFSGHGSKRHKLILGGTSGRGREVDRHGLVKIFGLYKHHVRLVLLNACFTKTQSHALAGVIDYAVGTGKGMGDKGGVAFAGAFYRALGFGKSVKESFESAKAELGLTKIPRTSGIELFVRSGISENDSFPQRHPDLSGASSSLRLFDPLVRSSDRAELFPDGGFLSEAAVFERAETSDAQILGNRTLERWLVQQTNSVTHIDRCIRLKRSETSAPRSDLVPARGKRSTPALTRLRGSKRGKRANPGPSVLEAEPESYLGDLGDYLVVSVKVEKSLRIVTRVSQKETARADQAGRNGTSKKSIC
jgi:hypothetical protein